MRVQMDAQIRVVALSNLEAMCARLSQTCHRFAVTSVNLHSVRVKYSNPDEYGAEHAVLVTYPAFRDPGLDRLGLFVVLHPVLVTGGHKDESDPIQYFDVLMDCPQLFRPNPDSQEWLTYGEIEARRAAKP